MAHTTGKLLYENPLAGTADLQGFKLEGQAALTFPLGRLRVVRPRAGWGIHWVPANGPPNGGVRQSGSPYRSGGLNAIHQIAQDCSSGGWCKLVQLTINATVILLEIVVSQQS